MSRFYLDEEYIPRVQRLLDAGLSNTEIGMRLGFNCITVKRFINKHKLVKTLRIKAEI